VSLTAVIEQVGQGVSYGPWPIPGRSLISTGAIVLG
jgi:hypothetical protein